MQLESNSRRRLPFFSLTAILILEQYAVGGTVVYCKIIDREA